MFDRFEPNPAGSVDSSKRNSLASNGHERCDGNSTVDITDDSTDLSNMPSKQLNLICAATGGSISNANNAPTITSGCTTQLTATAAAADTAISCSNNATANSLMAAAAAAAATHAHAISDSELQQQQQQHQQQQQAATLSAVEELVYEIKENLRLKARPAAAQTVRSSRPSPYHIPCRSWSESATACDKQQLLYGRRHRQQHQQQQQLRFSSLHHSHHHNQDEEPLDDPYELLQTLLKSNNLVKEAVRRLQLNYTATGGQTSAGGSTGGSASSNCESPRRPFTYYDSDSEDAAQQQQRLRMCQLEL